MLGEDNVAELLLRSELIESRLLQELSNQPVEQVKLVSSCGHIDTTVLEV